jgi:diadenosine tetraphosphate (Ap4A) HIT family hydrolase
MEIQMNCPFCSPENDEIILQNAFWYARWDKYPVSKGHMLVIPFRHIQNCFDLSEDERSSLFELIDACKKLIDEHHAPDGYNIGANIGYVAGQSVMHCHIHVIPRYAGDTDHPRGGIRGVIPHKREY